LSKRPRCLGLSLGEVRLSVSLHVIITVLGMNGMCLGRAGPLESREFEGNKPFTIVGNNNSRKTLDNMIVGMTLC